MKLAAVAWATSLGWNPGALGKQGSFLKKEGVQKMASLHSGERCAEWVRLLVTGCLREVDTGA